MTSLHRVTMSLRDVTPPPSPTSLFKEMFETHDLPFFVQPSGCPTFPSSLPTGRNYSKSPSKFHLSFQKGLGGWGHPTSPSPEMVPTENSYPTSNLRNTVSTPWCNPPFSRFFHSTDTCVHFFFLQVCLHIEPRDQRWASSPTTLHIIFLRQILSLNAWLAYSARLAGQSQESSLLCLSSTGIIGAVFSSSVLLVVVGLCIWVGARWVLMPI